MGGSCASSTTSLVSFAFFFLFAHGSPPGGWFGPGGKPLCFPVIFVCIIMLCLAVGVGFGRRKFGRYFGERFDQDLLTYWSPLPDDGLWEIF